MFQQLICIGNMTRDPEMRYMPSGDAVTNFTIAVNESYTDRNGQRHDKTMWVRVAAWGRLAETCHQYLKKGRQVQVLGTLVFDEQTGGPNTFQRQDGSFGTGFEMRAQKVNFLGQAGGSSEANNNGDYREIEADANIETADDIPF